MVKIKILQGAYGARDNSGRVHPVFKGERTTVPEREAMRLVRLGVAEIISDAPPAPPHTPPAPPSDGQEQPNPSTDTPDDEPPENGPVSGEEGDSTDAEVARLERLLKDDLEQMAKDLSVDISGARNKHDIAVLVAAAESNDAYDPSEAEDEDIVR